MSRKHYIEVASAIRREVDASAKANDYGTVSALLRVARDLCRAFKADNSNFDRERFLFACGFENVNEANYTEGT